MNPASPSRNGSFFVVRVLIQFAIMFSKTPLGVEVGRRVFEVGGSVRGERDKIHSVGSRGTTQASENSGCNSQ
ncbi:hypothetical protein JG687_00019316 [Phytophthora cactorum]|uniref:Uncharacterized protein n=1 Tax=Phytophthora cactorum TaxID=29920 RepID=A0A329RJS1_9STRA|nr:hypothetical protein Pcac1_g17084 [Phytophthora cactorum]KAG2811184.1 hypothetical protein PC112_g15728 [Phytophthora cactorum]KAG2811596.1 hypothetical protein PC111_g15174 [Phytophthora cactorum]KAG2851602.1 hypothetical protein PC113_g15770 [Phytophthora cactorum]KAG2891873.1 hypothetical protein PC114_g16819 [Phytophthora cactorum]